MARMLHVAAHVLSLQDGMAEVRLDAPAACGSCGAQGACGGGRARRVRIAVAPGIGAGDRISLQLSEADLNRSALLAYLLPAAGMLLGALFLAPGGDSLAVLGAALGLGLGLVSLRLFGRRARGHGIHACDPDSFQGETS